jgi:hypothetical protein
MYCTGIIFFLFFSPSSLSPARYFWDQARVRVRVRVRVLGMGMEGPLSLLKGRSVSYAFPSFYPCASSHPSFSNANLLLFADEQKK